MAKLTAEFRQAALRRGIIVKTKRNAETPKHLYQAASLELLNLGFQVAPDELAGMSTTDLTAVLKDARTIIGADRSMTPIYPGFPKQVEDLDTLTLLFEQILHYWTGGAFLPDYPTIVREGLPLEDMLRNARKLKVLSAAATARKLIDALTTDAVAMSEDDKTILNGALQLHHSTLEEIADVTSRARNGENMQTFVAFVADLNVYTQDELLAAVLPSAGNLDQLLRTVLAVATQPADAKWAVNYTLAVTTLADRHARAVKMMKLSRASRRLILERMERLSKSYNADRFVTRQNLWRGVMRTVHPYDFNLTEAQKRAADIIHTNVEYRTFNSLVEEAMEKGKVKKAANLLAKHQPGNLLRRLVALLRLVKTKEDAEVLAKLVRESAAGAAITTLVSAYNGVVSANDTHTRVTRVAGLNNTMVERASTPTVKKSHLKLVVAAVEAALEDALKTKPAPKGAVAIESTVPVPLVRRDASTADRTLDRGQELALAGKGDILRIFGHWNNNQSGSGYMDIGVVLIDKDFEQIAISTWNTWSGARDWSTYSGDKHVQPGDSAPEFIDVKLAVLREKYPQAKWAAMTVQSWSGWPIANVDFIAGAMLRSNGEKGEVFDARTVATAFKPTTNSTQAVPFAVNLETGVITWIDSSNGSTDSGVSSSNDSSIGSIVYDEVARPRLTLGALAELWANAHGAATVNEPADREALLALLG